MPEFPINVAITTDVPTVEVTITPARPLAVGRHRFRLVVTDDSGNKSKPDEVELIVADLEAPTAVLTVPRIVAYGTGFALLGDRSFDGPGGRITTYAWTYLGPAV